MPLIDNEVTATTLVNRALGMIGKDPIASLEDDDDEDIAKMREIYVTIRDEILRSRPWNCAITFQALNATSNPNEEEYGYAFQLPTDPFALRILNLNGCNNDKYRIA